MPVIRGRLLSADQAPSSGELATEIARVGDAVVEQILSGKVPGPVDYDQPHDEWVVVLAGRAIVVVGDERVELESGDWVVLPANVPHQLLEVEPGTGWLAVHGGQPFVRA